MQAPTMGSEEWKALANPNYEVADYGHKAGMQTFGQKYQGQQDEAGGVVAMLEVTISDFSQVKADTLAAERQAAIEYKDFMTESKKNNAVKTQAISLNDESAVDAKSKLAQDNIDLKTTQDQAIAADKYYEKL